MTDIGERARDLHTTILSDGNDRKLNTKIERWLKSNPDSEVVSIKLAAGAGSYGEFLYALIVYKP